ncbi:hypothetical protein CBS101457_001927 [Exobasidium rhododendri]|nr:hypothetical protein CBS101457_001927 [Exobasidium rhododendri]
MSTIPPSVVRRSSTSSIISSGDSLDADLIGSLSDLDGAPIDVTSHPTSTLTDLLQTFFSGAPRLDLDALDRKLKETSSKVRQKIRKNDSARRGDGTKSRSAARKEELRRLREQVNIRVDRLSVRWTEQKNVRLRDKICFVVSVMNMVITSLIFAYRPEWMPITYTLQTTYFMPLRVYSYTRQNFTYFLFDYCYFSNVLNLAYIWIFPGSPFLFTVCYCASHGPLAFSIATWRNSAVFHSLEKMTSLFIHLYPPIVFCAMRHFMPVELRHKRFPAMKSLPTLDGWTAFASNLVFYLFWQLLYYVLITLRKKDKIASGERINSYSTMSKGKGAVANLLAKAPIERREPAFILLQFVYTIVCTLPAPLLFYKSKEASAIFCLLLILLSVWNGAGYYVEVWGRRFERELDALKREIEATQRASAGTDESAPGTRPPSEKGSDNEEGGEGDAREGEKITENDRKNV